MIFFWKHIGLYEDLNSHLLTLTQLAEESTALTVCPFGQRLGEVEIIYRIV